MGPWEAFKQFIFWCTKELYFFCGDWGLAIILITIIFRIIIFPITNSQFKSSYTMSKLQPQIKEIQNKYAGDQQRIQQETQRLYSENHYNPLMGCLPLVLQMPIFIALFQVLRSLDTYIANAGLTGDDAVFRFYNIIQDLSLTPREAYAQGWATLIPYIILILIFTATFFIPMFLQGTKPDKTTLLTTCIMSVMMLWVSLQSPGGVMLYWDMNSVLGVIQQAITKAVMKKKERNQEEAVEVIARPVEISVVRKEQKRRPSKKR